VRRSRALLDAGGFSLRRVIDEASTTQ